MVAGGSLAAALAFFYIYFFHPLFKCKIVFFFVVLQETYVLIDAKFYADNTAINNWTQSGEGNYNSNYLISSGETLVMKIKTLSNRYVVGVSGGSTYSQFQDDLGTYKIYWTGNSQIISTTITTDSIIKQEFLSDGSVKWYVDDVLVYTTPTHTLTNATPMIRKYSGYPFDIEYMYVI